jgi:hypothetical protein
MTLAVEEPLKKTKILLLHSANTKYFVILHELLKTMREKTIFDHRLVSLTNVRI